MNIFSTADADFVRDALIKRFGELPKTGIFAGQAVASALYPQYNIEQGMMRDLDIFIPEDREKHKDKGLVRGAGDIAVKVHQGSFALFGCIEKSIGGYYVTNSTVDADNEDFNRVSINFKSGIKDIDQQMHCLVSAFDLNCCQLAYDPVRHVLIGTQEFSDFLSSQEINITYLCTPMHTTVRYLKKRQDMPFLKGDTHNVMTILQNAIEVVTRNGNYKSGYMVNNLFSDIYKARFDEFSDVLGQYFSIKPKIINFKKDVDSPFGKLSERKTIQFYVLESKSYDTELIDWYEREVFLSPSGNFESIMTILSPILLESKGSNLIRACLKSWIPHLPKTNERDGDLIKAIILSFVHKKIAPTESVIGLLKRTSNEVIGYLTSLNESEVFTLIKHVERLYQNNLMFLLSNLNGQLKDDKATHHFYWADQSIKYPPTFPHQAAYNHTIDSLIEGNKKHNMPFSFSITNLCIRNAFAFNEPESLFTWINCEVHEDIGGHSLSKIDENIDKNTTTRMVGHLADHGVSYDRLYNMIGRHNDYIQHPKLYMDILLRVNNTQMIDLDIAESFAEKYKVSDLEPWFGSAVILYVLNAHFKQTDGDILNEMYKLPEWLNPYCLKILSGEVIFKEALEFDDQIPF